MDVLQEAIDRWNAQADEFNQWDSLGQDEKDEVIKQVLSEKTYSSNQ